VIPWGEFGGYVPTSQGMPGWNAFVANEPVTEVLHNNATLGSPVVRILGPDWPYGVSGRIEGRFTASLWAMFDPGSSAAISQTGLVPADSRWLLFKGRAYAAPSAPPGIFTVSLDGQTVPVSVLATYADYSLYGGEISGFAGREVELRFTVPGGYAGTLQLDSIEFSPVPEPGTLAPVGLGLLAAAWLRGIRPRRPLV